MKFPNQDPFILSTYVSQKPEEPSALASVLHNSGTYLRKLSLLPSPGAHGPNLPWKPKEEHLLSQSTHSVKLQLLK